jgi:hypothetical protein
MNIDLDMNVVNEIDITVPLIIIGIALYILYSKSDKCYAFGKNKICAIDVFIMGGLGILLVGYVPFANPFRVILDNVYFSFIDGWIISHVLLYTFFGYRFPNKLMFFTFVGIFWEIIENFLSTKTNNIKLFGMYLVKNNNDINTDWWYGRSIDIVANTLGYSIGEILQRNYGSNPLEIIKNELIV